jgi:biotin carboxyl carrier protein
MPGKIIKVLVRKGDKVSKGDVLLVVEAMKMENNIISPADAEVSQINIETGNVVDTNTTLLLLTAQQ